MSESTLSNFTCVIHILYPLLCVSSVLMQESLCQLFAAQAWVCFSKNYKVYL